MKNLIKIRSFSARAEAELIKNILEKNGIKSMIYSSVGGASHISLFHGPCELLIKREDVDKAEEILKVNSN